MKTLFKVVRANLIFFAGCLMGSIISSLVFGIYLGIALDNEQVYKIRLIRDCLLEENTDLKN